MNFLTRNKRPVHAGIYGTPLSGDPVPMRVDADGRPVLRLDATQTVAASALDIRSLSAARDTANITASDFAIRPLDGDRDGIAVYRNDFYVESNTETIPLLGSVTVLQVDTMPYASSAFMVRADSVSALTSVFLQISPVTTASHFVTVAQESGILFGNTYLLVPTMSLRFMRIFATGALSRLTAYYVGQR